MLTMDVLQAFEYLLDAGALDSRCRELALEHIPIYAPFHPKMISDTILVLLRIANEHLPVLAPPLTVPPMP
jgi:hypothetical protein